MPDYDDGGFARRETATGSVECEPLDCTCDCPDGEGQHVCGCEVYDTPRMQDLRSRLELRRNELSAAIKLHAPNNVISGEIFAAAVEYAEACAEATAEDRLNPNGAHSPIVS